MNDEQIMQRSGDEGDIEAYANQNGANLTKFDVEIDEKIQEQQFMTRRNSELVVVNDEPMLAYDGLKLDEQVAANMLVAYNHAQQNLYHQLQKAREEERERCIQAIKNPLTDWECIADLEDGDAHNHKTITVCRAVASINSIFKE